MKTHHLKTDPLVFQAVWDNAKTFEMRFNDRGFQVGDLLVLVETTHTGVEIKAGAPLDYTGRACSRIVSHLLEGYGLRPGWCCLSFKSADRDAYEGARHDLLEWKKRALQAEAVVRQMVVV